jgi:hypothetical protein
MPIHDRYSNTEFISRITERAFARRRSDMDKIRNNRRGSGRAFVGQRSASDLCYAYSIRSGEYYTGYSSIAGGMYGMHGFLGDENNNGNLGSHKTIEDKNLPGRRLNRLITAIGPSAATDPEGLDRTTANCAEACAYSIALSYDEELEDLFFVTFYREGGPGRSKGFGGGPLLKAPCRNCLLWLKNSYGYWEGECKFPRGDFNGGSSSSRRWRSDT